MKAEVEMEYKVKIKRPSAAHHGANHAQRIATARAHVITSGIPPTRNVFLGKPIPNASLMHVSRTGTRNRATKKTWSQRIFWTLPILINLGMLESLMTT